MPIFSLFSCHLREGGGPAGDGRNRINWVPAFAGMTMLALASPVLAIAPSANSAGQQETAQDKQILADRLMAALPLEAEQIAILDEAGAASANLVEQNPERTEDIAAAYQNLENCVRTGMNIDIRAAMRDKAARQLELEELQSLAAFYESDAFKELDRISVSATPTLDEKKQLMEIVMRPDIRKFSRLIVGTGIDLARSGKEQTPDRDCKAEHKDNLSAVGLS